jgi:hypothetical protein
VSEKIGILYKDGKYRMIGGISGPERYEDHELIVNYSSITLWKRIFKKELFVGVYSANSIELFKGSVNFVKDSTRNLTKDDVKIFDWHEDKEIEQFSLDTIHIEPLMNPEMMYKNCRELYYFAGLHEIFHITPENIEIQLEEGDSETGAMKLECKAFKKRLALNRKNIIYPKS